MAINITQGTSMAVQSMVKQSFICNAVVDRIKSVLGVDLAYNNTADKIHIGIAHIFPVKLGDTIGDILEGYNQSVIYGDIPTQSKEYNSAEEALVDLLEVVIDYQNELNMCAKISFENMDFHVFKPLLDLIGEYSNIVKQCILLVDKIKLYKDNPSFDSDIDKFWIL